MLCVYLLIKWAMTTFKNLFTLDNKVSQLLPNEDKSSTLPNVILGTRSTFLNVTQRNRVRTERGIAFLILVLVLKKKHPTNESTSSGTQLRKDPLLFTFLWENKVIWLA